MSGAAPPLGASARAAVALPFAIVTLLWGSTWLVIADQIGTVPPSWSVTYRFVIATTATMVWAKLSGASLRIGRDGQLLAMALGLAQFTLNFNFVYRAEQHITSGLVAVVFGLLLVPNAVLGRLFLGARLSRPFLLGSAVAVGGVALLFHHELVVDRAGTAAVVAGIGFTLLGVLSASAGNILQATERARALPIASLVGWGMFWGTVGDAAWAWATVGPPQAEWRAGYWAGLAYLGLFASALAFPLYYRVIRLIGPGRAAYSSVLVPVIAMTLSTVFEGYRWSLEAAAGGLLVAAGLVVALAMKRA